MRQQSDNLFVLTGGPGSGKTTLIEALKARGHSTMDEAGRGVIREQERSGGGGLPWIDPQRFAELMLEWELRSYRQAQRHDGPVFFDRGLPDTLGYLKLEGFEVPATMQEEALRLRYNRRAFVAPPWKAIYGNDEHRRQSWELAVRTYEVMCSAYAELGYELVELPRVSVEERVAFLVEAAAPAAPASSGRD